MYCISNNVHTILVLSYIETKEQFLVYYDRMYTVPLNIYVVCTF